MDILYRSDHGLGKYWKKWSQLFFLGFDRLAVLAKLSKRFIAESPWLYETAAVSSVYSRESTGWLYNHYIAKSSTSHAFREMQFIVSKQQTIVTGA